MNSVHLLQLRDQKRERCSRLLVVISRERKCSFSLDFRQLNRQFSTEQEVKLFYLARATRGHRFGGVPTTPRGMDLFLLVLIFG